MPQCLNIVVGRRQEDFPHHASSDSDRAFSRHLIASCPQFLGVTGEPDVGHEASGAPHFRAPGPHLSISHDDGLTAVATSTCRTGIDVQRVGHVSPRLREVLVRHEPSARDEHGRVTDSWATRSWLIKRDISK